MQRSWNKYEEPTFSIEIIEEVPKEHLFEVEQKYLDIYFGKPACMNLNPLASGGSGPRSEKTKRRMSESAKQRGEVYNANMSRRQMGHPMNEETRQKISRNHADVAGTKNPFFGKNHIDTSKEKMRKAHLGRLTWNKGKHNNNPACKHGHLFTSENTYINPKGVRCCRTCATERNQKRRKYKGILVG